MESKFVENSLFSKNIVYCTALYLAAQNGHKNIVKYISELPIDTKSRGLSEFTRIFLSAQNGGFDNVKAAIESMFDENKDDYDEIINVEESNETSEVDVQSCMTIHEAAKFGSENLIKSFIETGTGVNAENDDGYTSLQIAAENGNVKCVEVLIQKGATIDCTIKNDNIDQARWGKTALHITCESGHFGSVSKLLSYGADLEAKDYNGNVPLYYAAKHGSKSIVQILLKKGADIDASNKLDQMVITEACNENVIDMLLMNDFDYKYINKYGCSILHQGAHFDNDILINFLLKNKMKINIEQREEDGYSPLLYAVHYNSCKVIKVLLKYGANIHSLNARGENALHVGVDEGSIEAIELLLENGADVNATATATKETALIWAVKKNQSDIIKLLLSHEADVKLKDIKNKSALDYAVENNNQEIILMLRKCYN